MKIKSFTFGVSVSFKGTNQVFFFLFFLIVVIALFEIWKSYLEVIFKKWNYVLYTYCIRVLDYYWPMEDYLLFCLRWPIDSWRVLSYEVLRYLISFLPCLFFLASNSIALTCLLFNTRVLSTFVQFARFNIKCTYSMWWKIHHIITFTLLEIWFFLDAPKMETKL